MLYFFKRAINSSGCRPPYPMLYIISSSSLEVLESLGVRQKRASGFLGQQAFEEIFSGLVRDEAQSSLSFLSLLLFPTTLICSMPKMQSPQHFFIGHSFISSPTQIISFPGLGSLPQYMQINILFTSIYNIMLCIAFVKGKYKKN